MDGDVIAELLAREEFTFAVQVKQYPANGRPGISYFEGIVPIYGTVDCLLYRDKHGKVRGILNHYPTTFPLEKAGNVNIFVEPRFQRKGIAHRLLAEAVERWPSINLLNQKYSAAGKATVASFIEKYKVMDKLVSAEFTELDNDFVCLLAQRTGRDEAEVREVLEASRAESRVYLNSRYQVQVRDAGEGIVHLSIKRLDKEPIHDWRDLQAIKNQLVGEECEAIELYPAESRRVDSANQYHLWCMTDPKARFPVGWETRNVTDETLPNTKQRKFDE